MPNPQVAGRFSQVFGADPAGVIGAPGRVNLIGEHTDYNDGFVLPIAINKHVLAAYAPTSARARRRRIRFHSVQAGATVELDPDAKLAPAPGAWSNYPVGVVVELVKAGLSPGGADVLFDSTVPLGGGLSSSAALEVAAALALMAAWGRPRALDGRELALLCQRAENLFAGAPCGIMDQSIVVMAQAGRAMLLDCRGGQTRQVPFDDPGVVLLVADTQVKHNVGEGGYPLRRRQCHEAAARLGVKALRDVTPAQLVSAGKHMAADNAAMPPDTRAPGRSMAANNAAMAPGTRAPGRSMAADNAAMAPVLAGDLLKRARHAVGEIARTLEAVEVLEKGDYRRFGQLMYASHESLRDDFEVSCEELDAIVAAARDCPGVYGARMTGGGFGGCAIILSEASAAGPVGEHVAAAFAARFGRRCPVFATTAMAGAR